MDAIFVHHPEAIRYKFNEHHPFNQNRLRLTIDLLQAANALQPHHIVIPREASEEELLSVHTVAYVNAVKNLSDPAPSTDWILQAEKYGLSSGDTPFFPEMHTIASALVGGSIEAADAVMSGRSRHALHLGGGLHHALSGRGAGFCVYNDAAAAIRYIQQRYHARVLYIDTDVHHGDGVQWIFYTDPDVCTFSIHETGKHLFPGTGELTERGEGLGFGYCFNMPVEPYTEDQSWMENFQEIAEQVIAHFKPDIIVSQHGCDAHVLDPLSHLHCSMDIYHQMPKLIHNLAHTWCEGRWVALGGGGYDIWRVVPRAWSLLWLVMSDHPLSEQISHHRDLLLPKQWIEAWQQQSPVSLPTAWLDAASAWEAIPRRSEIAKQNNQVKERVLIHLSK